MSDPVTLHVRQIPDILEQARGACADLGLETVIFTGSGAEDLVSEIGSILTRSGGSPAAIVMYSGSDYADHPRRTAEIDIIVMAASTRVNGRMSSILPETWRIAEALDDTITQELSGEFPITDKWKLISEQSLDLKGTKAAIAAIMRFDVYDY